MATATPRSSSPSSSRTLNGASRSTKRNARRAAGGTMTNFLSRESAAIARRASNLYSSTRAATREHPMMALGVVAGAAALLGGLWYAWRGR
jgi:hypothetical protein